MKRLTTLMMALLLVTGAAFAETAAENLAVRTFQFRHKAAEKAATAIKQLMSAEGSMSIQPSTNALVVTDTPENMRAIAAELAKFDTPAQQFRVTVRLVMAGKVAADQAPKVKDELKDVAAKLAVLKFNSLEPVGNAELVAKEGEPGMVDMNGYRADFRLGEYDAASDTIKLEELKVARLANGELAQILKTTMNVKLGQTTIVFAAKQPQSSRALAIVVTAKR
jgi:hypothetical protein